MRVITLALVVLLALLGGVTHTPSNAAYTGLERLYYTGEPVVPGCFPQETQIPLVLEQLDTTSEYTFEALVVDAAFQPYMAQRFTQTPSNPGGSFTVYLFDRHDFTYGQQSPAAFPLPTPVTIMVRLCSGPACTPGSELTGALFAGYDCQQGTFAWAVNWSRDPQTNTCYGGPAEGLVAPWFMAHLCP